MSASAKNYLLWVVAQFDPFSRDLVLSSEVVADSVSSEDQRFQFQCRCPLVRILFLPLFCVKGKLEISYQIVFKF